MNTTQDILNTLHDKFEMTDKGIGDILEISREYVSRLRHGKQNASSTIAANVHDLYSIVLSENRADQATYASGDESEVSYVPDENEDEYDSEAQDKVSIPWGPITIALLFVLLIAAVIFLNDARNLRTRSLPTGIVSQ